MTPSSRNSNHTRAQPYIAVGCLQKKIFSPKCLCFLVFLWLGKELMGARHNPRLAHACTELTTLFSFFLILQTAVKGWRSSKQNKKVRRGLVHRVSSSSDCFFLYLSLSLSLRFLLVRCVLLCSGWLAYQSSSPTDRVLLRIVNSLFAIFGSLLACPVAFCLNRMAFLGSTHTVGCTQVQGKIEAHSEDRGPQY